MSGADPVSESTTRGRRERPVIAVALVCLVSAATAATSPAASSPALVRGPYLQMTTPGSVIVRWRTDVPTESVVRYGPAPGNWSSFALGSTPSTTEHLVTVSGLAAGTKSFYSIGTSTVELAGGDAGHFFVTSPPPGTAASTLIWVLGDSGTGTLDARNVRDGFLAASSGRHADLILLLGDNAYSSGTDNEYQVAFFDVYGEQLRSSPVWPSFGNHDGGFADSATESGPYYDIFSLPRQGESGGTASGTEAYYSFDHGDIHLISLDSSESDLSAGGPMMTWLAADAASTDAEWMIAYWHHPPYTKGSHDSDTETKLIAMRENALPILETEGVDLVLSGHSHSYERSVLIDGHYDDSTTFDAVTMVIDGGDGRPTGDGHYVKTAAGGSHEGAVYVVAGSSGKISGGVLDHPVMTVSENRLGSLLIEVTGHRLTVRFIDDQASEVDTFQIVKALVFADGFESGSTAAWSP